jgi:hypothetical protein
VENPELSLILHLNTQVQIQHLQLQCLHHFNNINTSNVTLHITPSVIRPSAQLQMSKLSTASLATSYVIGPAILLRAYEILNEINTFLRLNHTDGEPLHEVMEIEKEFNLWETDPALRAQILEAESMDSPVQHYYQTWFAVNCRYPAILSSTRAHHLFSVLSDHVVTFDFLYYVPCDHVVTFVFQSELRRHHITLPWTELPYHTRWFVFCFQNVIPPPLPRIVGRDQLPHLGFPIGGVRLVPRCA